MKIKLAACAAMAAALLIPLSALAQVHVRGYTRKDGTYVAPHYRSSPNHTRLDNYSTRGNFNPYTGREGKSDPYSQPSYNPYTAQPQSNPYASPRPYSYGGSGN